MAAITTELEQMGFRWAYRLVDSRFTGVPQRRQRVILVASRTNDPRTVLFTDDAGERSDDELDDDAFGFYWTEGLRGLGWAQDAVPTLKGGSTVGIPSPPAVWLPDAAPEHRFTIPGIATGERLQGFDVGWTEPDIHGRRSKGVRWKMVGNAVTVGVSRWVGERLADPGAWDKALQLPHNGGPWPTAAWGESGKVWSVQMSMWPRRHPLQHLRQLMGDDNEPLSLRAASGFLSRLERSRLRIREEFRLDLQEYVNLRAAA
jgi:DNA (cytosine-5)-methyltransferase 1